jgi:hypothetical protein
MSKETTMDNTNHTEPKTTAPMRELTDDELRVVAGGGSVDTLAAASNKPNPGKMSWEHYFDKSSAVIVH